MTSNGYDEGSDLAGRYRLGPVLGQGGMSTVRMARDLLLDRDVAVKLFTGDGFDPALEQRQLAEVRLLARLTHPNLVTLYDAHLEPAGEGHQPSYLVTELVDGSALNVRLRTGPLEQVAVAQLGRQLADGLAYIAAAGVIHRDVKPANILLAREGGAKLVDFGIARLIDSTRLTSTGLTIGTAPYLSPEQVEGHDLTPAADVYSLGLVLLECLTGRAAYIGTGSEVALARLVRQPVIPGAVSVGLRTLLAEMLDRDPAVRPSAAEVSRRLAGLPLDDRPGATALLTGADLPTEQFGSPPTRVLSPQALELEPEPTDRRRRPVLLLTCAGVAVVAALGLVGILRSGSSHPPASIAPIATPTPAAVPAGATGSATGSGTGNASSAASPADTGPSAAVSATPSGSLTLPASPATSPTIQPPAQDPAEGRAPGPGNPGKGAPTKAPPPGKDGAPGRGPHG